MSCKNGNVFLVVYQFYLNSASIIISNLNHYNFIPHRIKDGAVTIVIAGIVANSINSHHETRILDCLVKNFPMFDAGNSQLAMLIKTYSLFE